MPRRTVKVEFDYNDEGCKASDLLTFLASVPENATVVFVTWDNFSPKRHEIRTLEYNSEVNEVEAS